MKEALVMFAKAPRAGAVKTRLIGDWAAEQALELYVCFLRDTFAVMEDVQAERESLALVLCYTPADDIEAFEVADLDGCLLLAQRGNDLGERLQNCFADLFEAGFASVVIIGADSPTLPVEILEEAFALLSTPDQIVLGPSEDGGFYLLGLRAVCPQLFQDIAWGSAEVLSQMQARAADRKLELLPTWYDLDTPADVEKLRAQIAAGEVLPQHTRRYLKKLRLT